MSDKTTEKILAHLSENARMSWAELGKRVHLTPQAVAVRVNKLVEEGTIRKFTITQNNQDLPATWQRHFITVFLETTDFRAFEEEIIAQPVVDNLYKISGKGCYHLQVVCEDNDRLEAFLDIILRFGRYSLASSIRQII